MPEMKGPKKEKWQLDKDLLNDLKEHLVNHQVFYRVPKAIMTTDSMLHELALLFTI